MAGQSEESPEVQLGTANYKFYTGNFTAVCACMSTSMYMCMCELGCRASYMVSRFDTEQSCFVLACNQHKIYNEGKM